MAARKKIPRKTGPPTAPEPPPAADPAPPERPTPAAFPVVGIGASAGGLDAFKKFFAAMPADGGLAFVLVPHLDPHHESLMAELLRRHTTMPVVEAADGAAVEPNHVYVIPPNKDMALRGGRLRLSEPALARRAGTSIDFFLRSLGEDQQEKAIGVIFSGTGAHGTVGLKAIKEAGGLVVVQDPATAQYD